MNCRDRIWQDVDHLKFLLISRKANLAGTYILKREKKYIFLKPFAKNGKAKQKARGEFLRQNTSNFNF